MANSNHPTTLVLEDFGHVTPLEERTTLIETEQRASVLALEDRQTAPGPEDRRTTLELDG